MEVFLIILLALVPVVIIWSAKSAGSTIDSATRAEFKRKAMTGPCPYCNAKDHGKKFHSARAYHEGLWK